MAAKAEVRFDRHEVRLNAEKTPEGYLKGVGVVGRTGVFPYRNEDGSVRFELVHPEDLFSKASMASLRNIPITLGHPKEMVTAANAKAMSVGHVGEGVEVDYPLLSADVIVTDAAAIRAIEAGKQELSTGYFLDLHEESGVYEGQAYNYRQRNIRQNHLAIVDKARFGSDMRINSDVPYAVRVEARNNENPNEEKKMVKVTINGIQYEAAPEVAKELERLNAASETLKGEKETVKAKLDTMTGERDGFKTKLETATNEAPAKILAAAKARAALVGIAAKVLDEEAVNKLDTMTDLEIKTAVVLSKSAKGTSLNGQSEAYIQARFDIATENVDKDNADDKLAAGRKNSAHRDDNAPEKGGQDDARARMLARLNNGGKEPKKDEK
jgi:hypothetical protein